MHDKVESARFLLASFHFAHNSRKAANISRVCGVSHHRVVAWTFTKQMATSTKLLEITDLQSAEEVVLLMSERKKGRGDLDTAEKVWTALISENAHIQVPDAFDKCYQIVFGEHNETTLMEKAIQPIDLK